MSEGLAPPASRLSTLRSIFLRWERLRPLYNLILAAVVLFPSGGRLELPEVGALLELAVGAVLANLCYLAGPVAETYLAWLGLRTRWVTAGLFLGGTIVSLPLVFTFSLAWTLVNS